MGQESQKLEAVITPGSATEAIPELLEGESIVFVSSKPRTAGIFDVWVTVRFPGIDREGNPGEREVTIHFAGTPYRPHKIYRMSRPRVKARVRPGLYLKMRAVAQAEWKRHVPDAPKVREADSVFIPDTVQNIRVGASPRGGKAVFIAIKTRRDTFVMAFEKHNGVVRRALWDKTKGNVAPSFYLELVQQAKAALKDAGEKI